MTKRFFVTPVDGHNFSGVLIRSDRSVDGYSVFEDVKVHVSSGRGEPVQGTLYQRNSNIAHAQEMPVKVEESPPDVDR